jgi:hypothetical protein
MAKKKNPAAVALGRLGGKVGGTARVPKGFSSLTPEERSESAKRGAAARWGTKKAGKGNAGKK